MLDGLDQDRKGTNNDVVLADRLDLSEDGNMFSFFPSGQRHQCI